MRIDRQRNVFLESSTELESRDIPRDTREAKSLAGAGKMGQDFSECWASAWPVIGEAFERALAGETSYLENQRMFLDRNGYLEETFFTFSFSPILDESGGVGGLSIRSQRRLLRWWGTARPRTPGFGGPKRKSKND